jgi:hypothetical protein
MFYLMMRIVKRYIVLKILAIMFVPLIANAQHTSGVTVYHVVKTDQQVMPLLTKSRPDSIAEPLTNTSVTDNIDELLSETNGLAESKVNRQFSRALKRIRIRDIASQGITDRKAYTRMADLFVRLKLYPLAMKCYLKTLPVVSQSNLHLVNPDATDSFSTEKKTLTLNLKDDSLFNQKAEWLENHVNEKCSEAVGSQRITEAFNDSKTAIAYALLFHVKQPVPGKHKVFHLINTGHTFITLIKYNDDSTFVTRSFGFYPKKDNILSATPLLPSTSSTFKDDGGHNWDELVGKFISHHKFVRILKLVSQFSESDYQLSSNNCTDLAISAATIAGI